MQRPRQVLFPARPAPLFLPRPLLSLSYAPVFSLRPGFIPKAVFLERLATDRESVSVFLLLAILSLSARFTPCLAKRYGDPVRATEYFMRQAAGLVPDEMYKPSLERTQGFVRAPFRRQTAS